MSHTFKFGSFAKRKNSTLQPTILTSFVDYDVLFKNPTSLDNPTITLNIIKIITNFFQSFLFSKLSYLSNNTKVTNGK